MPCKILLDHCFGTVALDYAKPLVQSLLLPLIVWRVPVVNVFINIMFGEPILRYSDIHSIITQFT